MDGQPELTIVNLVLAAAPALLAALRLTIRHLRAPFGLSAETQEKVLDQVQAALALAETQP